MLPGPGLLPPGGSVFFLRPRDVLSWAYPRKLSFNVPCAKLSGSLSSDVLPVTFSGEGPDACCLFRFTLGMLNSGCELSSRASGCFVYLSLFSRLCLFFVPCSGEASYWNFPLLPLSSMVISWRFEAYCSSFTDFSDALRGCTLATLLKEDVS